MLDRGTTGKVTAMIEKLSIRHLRTLRILHETGSMRETALQVFRSQPAVSLQIRDLEEIVGFRLIYHRQGAVVFTGQGELFARAAAEFERQLEQQIGDLRNAPRAQISFGLTHDLYGACIDQQEEFADYGIELLPMTSRDVLAGVERGSLAAGVAKTGLPREDAIRTWFYRLGWAGAVPVKSGLDDPIRLVLLDTGCFYHHLALKLFENAHPMSVDLTICESWGEIAERLNDGGVTVVSSHWFSQIGRWQIHPDLPALPEAVLNLVRSKGSNPAAGDWGISRLGSIISASLTEEGGQRPGDAWHDNDIRIYAPGRRRQARG